ncbi:hypothetical protein [Kangiella shandongensis]|uniref:hypothetical protein n=1 Tax=Kangiella shandongensis TaxID=2763258 RepID=UPI001CBCD80A|nr:hypothetical protein [Kangiella shandongensis]
MNKAIHFNTSMFDVTKEKENPINPIYGASLLEWLRTRLKDNIDISEPDVEDWGWFSELDYAGASYLIGACAHFKEGDDPSSEIEWVFQVHKYRSLKEKLLGQNKMTVTDTCFQFFKELFEKEPEFKEVEVV